MADLFPGVRAVSARLSGSQQAASRAVALAQQAAARGTFGIGGILADRSGRVIAEGVNAVIDQGSVRDPTAHAERQLIDWYFEARRQGLAAAPQDLVIVTSLDPCAMCAGAILLSGLNCIAVAEDPTSGVHKDGKPTRMPEPLRARAEHCMAFFGVSGLRPRLGAQLGRIFANNISVNTLTDAAAAFNRSLDQVRELIGGGEGASEVTSFEQCDLSSLQSALPEGAWITLPFDAAGSEAAWRRALLSDSRDISFIADRTGQLIAGADSAEDRSPARSSVLELIRAYVEFRRLAAERLRIELPHQRFCTIVKRRPPELPEKALLELGAIGSFLEQPRPASSLPALAFVEWDSESSRIERYVSSLPPFYTEVVGIRVGPAKAMPGWAPRFRSQKGGERD